MSHFHPGHDWLEELDATTQRAIREKMHTHILNDGDSMYQPGEEATAFYQVVEGLIILKRHSREGTEYLATMHGPGECFGEVPLLMEKQLRGFEAVARGKTHVASLSQENFQQIALEHPDVYPRLSNKLCNIIISLLEQVESQSHTSLRQRLAKLLNEACTRHGKKNKDGIIIDIPLLQSDMGNMLGVTRQSIQRELRYWKDQNWISKHDGRILILEPEAIIGLCE